MIVDAGMPPRMVKPLPIILGTMQGQPIRAKLGDAANIMSKGEGIPWH
jgi:hypothetical protein